MHGACVWEDSEQHVAVAQDVSVKYSPLGVDRTWGIWGLYYNVPKPYSLYLRGTISREVW